MISTQRTANQIAKSIVDLCQSLKTDTNTITVSLIVRRCDNLNNKAIAVNGRLMNQRIGSVKSKTSHALIMQIQYCQKDI